MSLAEIENYQDTDFLELKDSSSRRNYEKCTKMIVGASLKPVEIKDFSLNRAKTKEVLSWILPILFEDIDVNDTLSKIKIDRNFLRDEIDIMVETNTDDELQSFYLSSFKNLTTIPLLMNAYANHVFYKDVYTRENFGNYNYKKIPGAVLEKITAFEATKETFLEHMEALDYSRLQHLKHAITLLDTMDSNSYRIPKDSFERKIYEYQMILLCQ